MLLYEIFSLSRYRNCCTVYHKIIIKFELTFLLRSESYNHFQGNIPFKYLITIIWLKNITTLQLGIAARILQKNVATNC